MMQLAQTIESPGCRTQRPVGRKWERLHPCKVGWRLVIEQPQQYSVASQLARQFMHGVI